MVVLQTSSPLVGIFLVVFDQKVGYTVAWQRTAPGIDLDGVEYKSLPSGLHEQSVDVIYYEQNGFAGVSAFARTNADAEHRNAQFVAVGILIDDASDDHQAAWRYVIDLGLLVQTSSTKVEDHSHLDEYWTKATTESNVEGHRDFRASITAPRHPVQRLRSLFDNIGALLLPLQRQVLLGQRILISARPPVEDNCALVYILSLLAPQQDHDNRTPLYNVGISDIATLTDKKAWIGCTTDTILKEKTHLYDILIDLAPDQLDNRHIRVSTAQGVELKVTARDVRVHNILHKALWRIRTSKSRPHDTTAGDELRLLPDDDEQYMGSHTPWSSIEHYTWSLLAVRSVYWWTDTEESVAATQEELEIDENLLDSIATDADEGSEVTESLAIIAYFHARAEMIHSKAKNIIEDNAAEDDIAISPSSLSQAGLDTWSQTDRQFFQDLLCRMSGKTATMVVEPVTICGVRLC